MDDFLARKDEKLKKLREEQALKELEGCAFSPNLATRRSGQDTQRRHFDQFLKDQQRFLEVAKQKREIMAEEIEMTSQSQVQPIGFMSNRSRQILLEKKHRTQSRESSNEGGRATPIDASKKSSILSTSQPRRDPRRDRPIEDILYLDAKRRQASLESKRQAALQKSVQQVPLVGRESQKLVI
jgi:hypothetical protein